MRRKKSRVIEWQLRQHWQAHLFFALWFLVCLEAVSFLSLSLWRREFVWWGDVRREQEAVLAENERSAYAMRGMRGEEKRTASGSAVRDEPFDGFSREILHPYLGFVNEATVPIGTGAYYGFQEAPDTWIREQSDDTYIMGIFGGSVAKFFFYEGTEELRATLKRHLSFSGKRIEFVLLALSGWKQPQQLFALNYYLSLGGHLDAAINIDGVNELILPSYENIPKGVFPFYPRSWFFRIGTAENADLFPVIGQLSYLLQKRSEWTSRFIRFPLRYSFTAEFVWRAIDTLFTRKIARREALLLAYEPIAAREYIITGPQRTYGSESAMLADVVAHWQRNSLLLHRMSEANGIRYFHFLQPNARLEGSKPLTPDERESAFAGSFPPTELVNRGYSLLRTAGQELARSGVPFRDMSSIFQAVRIPLYYDCCHVVPEGSEIMARQIGAFMLAHLP